MQTMSPAQWVMTFILRPLGQLLLFIAGSALLLTVISYIIAILIPFPNAEAAARENPIPLVNFLSARLAPIIVSGIVIGFVYAMIALGYTLVYGVLKFINFAHSEIFMVGAVVGFEVIKSIEANGANGPFGALPEWNPIPLVILMVLAGMLVSGLLAVVIERVAYRPLRGAPRLVPLISAIGISLFLIDAVRGIMAITRGDFNLIYPLNGLPWTDSIKFDLPEAAVTVRPTQIIVVVAAILMLLFLNYFVNGTKLGRGIRAVSQDATTAGLMGINANRMISLTFFVGGALGGAAGVLFALNTGKAEPTMGFAPGIVAFTAAVLGGIGSVPGALLGGLALGMVRSFLDFMLSFFPMFGSRYTDIFTFAILILILIFRPSGILGERVDEKV
jgi:branched-chain amino acid transport system permease protein